MHSFWIYMWIKTVQNVLKQNSVLVFLVVVGDGWTKYMRVQFWHFRFYFCSTKLIWFCWWAGKRAVSVQHSEKKMPTLCQQIFNWNYELKWRNSLCNPQLNRSFTLKFRTHKIPHSISKYHLESVIYNYEPCICVRFIDVSYIFENNRDPSDFNSVSCNSFFTCIRCFFFF